MNILDFEKLKNLGVEWEKSIKKSGLSSFKAGAHNRDRMKSKKIIKLVIRRDLDHDRRILIIGKMST